MEPEGGREKEWEVGGSAIVIFHAALLARAWTCDPTCPDTSIHVASRWQHAPLRTSARAAHRRGAGDISARDTTSTMITGPARDMMASPTVTGTRTGSPGSNQSPRPNLKIWERSGGARGSSRTGSPQSVQRSHSLPGSCYCGFSDVVRSRY